jgi:hypothetical protein
MKNYIESEKMKKLKLIIFIVLMSHFSAYSMSNSDFIGFTTDGSSAADKQFATLYVNGVTMGYIVSNSIGEKRNICFPELMRIDEYNYINLIKGEMELNSSVKGEYPVAITLYRAFKRIFPCK